MVIDCNYKDKNKGFPEPKRNEILNLFLELQKILNRNEPISKFEILQTECKVTDILKKLIESCNKNIFFNFNLELRMDDIEDAY